jgi:hypothetical protein
VEGVPLPHGWIGTTSDWVRGLGIAFAILNLVLLGFAWRSLRSGIRPDQVPQIIEAFRTQSGQR